MDWCDFEVSYFDELLWGGEAADAEGQQDPAAGVAALGRILRELFADLTVDLIPEARERDSSSTKPGPQQCQPESAENTTLNE